MTEIIASELKGILLRSRAKYIEGAEKTQIILQILKRKRQNRKLFEH